MQDEINLRDLFNSEYINLPDLVDSINCIYKITNITNNKCYIGQTKWLYGRFLSPSKFGHKFCYLNGYSNHLYNAISKYGPESFVVTILERDLNNLDEREIYWIDHFNSYEIGYNLTKGGENCDQLRTKEAQINQIKSLVFRSINNHLNTLKYSNLEIDAYNYVYYSNDSHCKNRHIPVVLNYFDELRSDDRWTEEMEVVFSSIKSNGIVDRYPRLLYMISCIDERFNLLTNNGYDINPYNYAWELCDTHTRDSHIPNVISYLDTLVQYKEFTEKMVEIFNFYKQNDIPKIKVSSRAISKMFGVIYDKISILNSLGLELNLSNYKSILSSNGHLISVNYYLDYLKKDDRWNSDMELIFKDFKL